MISRIGEHSFFVFHVFLDDSTNFLGDGQACSLYSAELKVKLAVHIKSKRKRNSLVSLTAMNLRRQTLSRLLKS